MSKLAIPRHVGPNLPRKVAFYAPGQSITSFGDGLRLLDESPETARIYDRVGAATGVDVGAICKSDAITDNPAIVQVTELAIGYASANVLNEHGIFPNFLVGVSSGELTVAAIAKVFSLEDGAIMAFERGESQLEEAGGLGGGFLVLHDKKARPKQVRSAIASSVKGFDLSHMGGNHTPHKTMVSFAEEEREELEAKLNGISGVRRVMRLKNLPFPPHGEFVQGTERRIGASLGRLMAAEGRMQDAAVAIVATRTARPMKKAATIARELTLQTTQPTNLEGGVIFVRNRGVLDHYDLGPTTSMSNSLVDFDLGSQAIIHEPGDYNQPGVKAA